MTWGRESPSLNLADFRIADREQCGIIAGVVIGKIRIAKRIIPVENVAKNQRDNYEILMEDLERVKASLEKEEIVVGFFHTHTSRHSVQPSEADYAGALLFPKFINLIYKPSTGEKVWYSALYNNGVAK